MCVARTSSSWRVCGVWVLTAAVWDTAAARCPLASSWQTRRECMPIADRAVLNWWPHPTPLPVYLCWGRARVTAGEYLASLNKLMFACRLMENQLWRLVLPLADAPFGRQCCVSQKCLPWQPAPLCFFFSLDYHHCFCSSWEHLELAFLCLLHILRAVFGERLCLCGTIPPMGAGTYRLTK